MPTQQIVPNSVDYDNIKQSFVNYLKTNPTFKGFDFSGDPINVVLDLLAGNTSYNIFYFHQALNERYLESALKRSQLVRLAQTVGVLPASSRSAVATIQVSLQASSATDIPLTTAVIPSGTVFNIVHRGKSLSFQTNRDVSFTQTAWKNGATFNAVINIDVYEGKEKTVNSSYIQNQNQSINLLDAKLDTQSIQVMVNSEIWQDALENPLNRVQSTDKVWWTFERPDGGYQITFGNDILGMQPANASAIEVSWLSTNQDIANGAGSASSWTPVFSSPDWTITKVQTISPGSGGSARQDAESIRSTAALSFGAQNRWVTDSDYTAAISQLLPSVTASRAWSDGKPGIVNLSILQADGNPLTSNLKTRLKTQLLNKMPLGTNVRFVDPTITTVVAGLVAHHDKKTTVDTNAVETALSAYADDFNGSFGRPFAISDLSNYITNSVNSINSVEINTQIVFNSHVPAKVSSFAVPVGVNIVRVQSNSFQYQGNVVSLTSIGFDLYTVGKISKKIGTIDPTRQSFTLTDLNFPFAQDIQFRVTPEQGRNIPVSPTNTIVISPGQINYQVDI